MLQIISNHNPQHKEFYADKLASHGFTITGLFFGGI